MSFLSYNNFTMDSLSTLPTISDLTLENVGDVIAESWRDYYAALESLTNDDYELTMKARAVSSSLDEIAFESAVNEFAIVMESAGKGMLDRFVEQIKKMGQGFLSILSNIGSHLGQWVLTNKKFAEVYGKKAKENPHAAGLKTKGYNFDVAMKFDGGRAFQETKTQLNKLGIALTSELPSPEKVNELVTASKNQEHANELRGVLLGTLTNSATAAIKNDDFVTEMKKRFRSIKGDKIETIELACDVDEAIKQLTSDSIVKKTADAKKACKTMFDDHIKAIKAYDKNVKGVRMTVKM